MERALRTIQRRTAGDTDATPWQEIHRNTFSAWLIVVTALVLYLLSSVRILKEYKRGAVFA